MGMSTHIVGIKPPDAKWSRMKSIYDACIAAQVTLPKEVVAFFDGEVPDDRGVLVYIERLPCVSKVNDASGSGFTVDITKLPPDVKEIQFLNSW